MTNTHWRNAALAAIAGFALTACDLGNGTSTSASTGVNAQLPTGSAPVAQTPAAGSPSITGTPATSATIGGSYTFTPTASGNTLSFSISGKPAWADFSTATGALTGAAEAGTFENIVISVTDGTNTALLPAFTISVGATPGTATATVRWAAPSQNSDGSPLTDLAGYRVYHGTNGTSFSEIVQVSGSTSTTYTFNQLTAGTHTFAVSAVTSTGVEGALSTVGSKTIM
jgi:hypothetical protein